MGMNLKEIAEQEQVPYSTLAGWIQRGLIEPSQRTGKSGAAVLLDDKNIVEFKNLIRLRKGGLPLQRARHLMEDLQATGFNPLSQGVFVVLDRRKGRVLQILTDKRAAREVLGPHKGQYVMIELWPKTAQRRPSRSRKVRSVAGSDSAQRRVIAETSRYSLQRC